MSKKKLKFQNAILCEHVAAGSNNKHILINVFSGDILVADMPADLALGVYLELDISTPDRIEIQLKLDRKVYANIKAAFQKTSERQKSLVLAIPLLTVGIDKDLTISVVGVAEGYANTTFIKKTIKKGSIASRPTASEQPS